MPPIGGKKAAAADQSKASAASTKAAAAPKKGGPGAQAKNAGMALAPAGDQQHDEKEHQAAVKIQARARGMLARKEVARMREHFTADNASPMAPGATPKASVTAESAITQRTSELDAIVGISSLPGDVKVLLEKEKKAREELEDMLLRLEKHFKAEQAARVKAEELMNAAITAESESKVALEDALRKQAQHLAELETERVAIKTERDALEAMRQAFENELNQARTEVAKAQRAVEGNGKLRANEMTVKSKHIGQLQGELDKLRKELDKRTEELERWRRQAHTAAAGVHEAKEELISRKRELEHTKKKMDRVLDDLLRAGVDIHAPMSSISHATHATTTTTTGRKQQTNSHPGATRRQTQERLKVAPMAASADNQRSWAAATVPPPSKPMAKASTAPLPVSKGARMLATVPNGHPVANGLKPKNGTKPMAAGQTMGGGGNGNGRPAPISMPAPAHGGGSPVKLAPLMTHSPVSSNGNLGSPVRQSHAPAALRDASFPTPKLAETTTMYVMRRQAEKQEEKKLRPKMPDRFLQGRANAEVHLAMVSKFAA